MTFENKFKQMRAYAQYDGLAVGLLLSVAFFMMLCGFRYAVCNILSIAILFLSYSTTMVLTLRFRRHLTGNVMSFRRGYGYALLTMLHAAIVLAIVQVVYFAWLDNGFFISQYVNIFTSAENAAVLKEAGLSDVDIKQMVSMLENTRPLQVPFMFFNTNVSFSLLLSIPIALVANKKSNIK